MYIRPSSGALDVELQHMVFCTEFLDGWWSWEPLRGSCLRCGWCRTPSAPYTRPTRIRQVKGKGCPVTCFRVCVWIWYIRGRLQTGCSRTECWYKYLDVRVNTQQRLQKITYWEVSRYILCKILLLWSAEWGWARMDVYNVTVKCTQIRVIAS